MLFVMAVGSTAVISTPWRTAVFERLIVPREVKKLLVFYGSHKIIRGSWAARKFRGAALCIIS
jgi:hypothetical protein